MSHRSGAVPVGRTHRRVRNAAEPLREAGNHHCQRAAVIRCGTRASADPGTRCAARATWVRMVRHISAATCSPRSGGAASTNTTARPVRSGSVPASSSAHRSALRANSVLMLPVISTAIRMPSGRITVRSAHRFAVSPG